MIQACESKDQLLQVLRAMRGELSKEIKRLETTYAANDARVVHLVNASAGRMQVGPLLSLQHVVSIL